MMYLRNRRKQLGMTMKEVADIIGVSESCVSRWETGHIDNMKRDKIAVYAKALETDPIFIMTGKTLGESTSPPEPLIAFCKADANATYEDVEQLMRFKAMKHITDNLDKLSTDTLRALEDAINTTPSK